LFKIQRKVSFRDEHIKLLKPSD